MSTPVQRKLVEARDRMLSGDLAAAASLCHEVLHRAPRDADALWLLGNVHLMRGRADEALPLLERSVAAAPGDGAALESLGIAHLVLRQYGPAEDALSRAASIPGAPASVHVRLGMARLRGGHHAGAIVALERALVLDPGSADARLTLGQARAATGDLPGAAREFEWILAREPRNADALHNLGVVAMTLGDAGRARACFEPLLLHEGTATAARERLATLDIRAGRFREAIAHLNAIVRVQPEDASAYNALGHALLQTGALDEAERAARTAQRIDPADPESYSTIAQVKHLTGALDEAARELKQGFERTDSGELLGAWGHLAHRMCDWPVWQNAWQRLAARLDHSAALGSPFALLSEATTAAQQLAYTQRWAAARFGPRPSSAPEEPPQAGSPARRRLRVGYFSADFHQHPVASLLVEVLERHDRERFEIFAYSYGRNDGSRLRARLERGVEHFIDVAWEPDDLLAQRLRADGLDLLMDLKGYTHGDRLQVMAARPARVQATWLGYPGTTGAEFIDYLIADEWLVPRGAEQFFTERVLRMPVCYQPSDRQRTSGAPRERSDYGLPADAFVFCCFNQSGKITPAVYARWMSLLARVPGSVLWLLEDNRWATQNLLASASAHGIAPARVVMAPRLAPEAHLARYRVADLALDTHPYTSHTTANETLWMGCPLVALCGETFAARVSGSVLRSCGFAELVTHTLDDYEALAYALATDPERLRGLRARLDEAREIAPLFDSARFARDLEALFMEMVEMAG